MVSTKYIDSLIVNDVIVQDDLTGNVGHVDIAGNLIAENVYDSNITADNVTVDNYQGNMHDVGNAYITGNVDVLSNIGEVTINGDINGNPNIDIDGDFNVGGSLDFGGNIHITGNTIPGGGSLINLRTGGYTAIGAGITASNVSGIEGSILYQAFGWQLDHDVAGTITIDQDIGDGSSPSFSGVRYYNVITNEIDASTLTVGDTYTATIPMSNNRVIRLTNVSSTLQGIIHMQSTALMTTGDNVNISGYLELTPGSHSTEIIYSNDPDILYTTSSSGGTIDLALGENGNPNATSDTGYTHVTITIM